MTLTTPPPSLLRPQRHRRLHLGGAAGGEVAGEQGDEAERERGRQIPIS
jgi:hypothetical protein